MGTTHKARLRALCVLGKTAFILAGYFFILSRIQAQPVVNTVLNLIVPNTYLLTLSFLLIKKDPPGTLCFLGPQRIKIALTIVACGIIGILSYAQFYPYGSAPQQPLYSTLLLMLLVPCTEEIFYRWFLLGWIQRLPLSKVASSVIVSAVFAAFHLYTSQTAILAIFLLSLGLCALVIATRSVLWAIHIHILWNTISLLREIRPGHERFLLISIAIIFILGSALYAVYMSHRKGST